MIGGSTQCIVCNPAIAKLNSHSITNLIESFIEKEVFTEIELPEIAWHVSTIVFQQPTSINPGAYD